MNFKDLPPFDQIPAYGVVYDSDTSERLSHFGPFDKEHSYVLIHRDGRFRVRMGQAAMHDTEFREALYAAFDKNLATSTDDGGSPTYIKDFPPFDKIPAHGLVYDSDSSQRIEHFGLFENGHMYILIYPDGRFRVRMGETASYDTEFREALYATLDANQATQQIPPT